MQIHELPTGNIEDANKLPFDTGTNTYATSFTALATAVVNKTFSALTTTAKTVLGAINELKTAVTDLKTVTTAETFTASNSYCNVSYSFTRCGSFIMVLVVFTPTVTITGSIGDVTLSNLPTAPPKNVISATLNNVTVDQALGTARLSAGKVFSAFGARTSGTSYSASFIYAA